MDPKIAKKLARLDIHNLDDLMLHCPYRYEDRTRLTPIKDLKPEQFAVIQGRIQAREVVKRGKKRCIVTLADNTSTIKLVFFHFYPSQLKQWQEGVILRCYGQVKFNSGLSIVHPEVELVTANKPLPSSLTSIYPTVAGISQIWLRKMIHSTLDDYHARNKSDQDNFYHHFVAAKPMLHWLDALEAIHRPLPNADLNALMERNHPAFNRLISEELFAHHMSLKQLRVQVENQKSESLKIKKNILQQFLHNLPFELTKAQQDAWQDIKVDLAKTKPMLRLVQGDVGCGKTVVAALAALAAVSQNHQAAIMVPTEILAEQHFSQFTQWFTPLGYRCELLTSKLKAKAKRSILENITLGITNIIIGTHALFQDNVEFQALGLVIIDEQHRFGVHQRLALQNKGEKARNQIIPHQLIMTATPIPRTLIMSHYAHLDISIINSLPPNRQKITTLAVNQSRRDEIVERIKTVCAKGQQVYWVCTLIEESETLQCQAATLCAQDLQQTLGQLRVGLVHGKMDKLEKEAIMQDFYQNKIAVLVATTVIEVGVNVPNATLMVIENPERLGLAQLHQLRGRVGRGSEASFCVLLYQLPLSETAKARLQIMRDSCDGFVIAEADLALRGPGEILGTRQTGEIEYKIVDLKRDTELLSAIAIVANQNDICSSEQLEILYARWGISREFSQA